MEIITNIETLRKPNEIVKLSEVKNIKKVLAPKMINLMRRSNGCGLAAPQVGINKRFFIALIDAKVRIFINPEIKNVGAKTETLLEGCLSIPGYVGQVERPVDVTIKYFDINTLKMKKETFVGRGARIVQHEENHLRGIVFSDIAESIEPITLNPSSES